MATGSTATESDATMQPTPKTGARRRWPARLPFGIWFPVAVFALMRLVDTIFIIVASRHQIPLAVASPGYYIYAPTPANPGYWSVIMNWDGQWYQRIATEGYAVADGSGSLESFFAGRAFGFLPLYPLLSALVMSVTGLGFAVSASIVSLLCGAAAMVVLFKVVERGAGAFAAACCVSLVSAFVAAPVLQLAYKESLVLLLLLLWFWWVQQRRYWWAAVAVLALCFTKYLTAPIALVMAAHAFQRWRLRPTDPVRRVEWLGMGSIVAISVVGVFAWGTLMRLWLGSDAMASNATLDAMANRASITGFGAFGQFYAWAGLVGLAIPVVIVCALFLLSFTPRAGSWGIEARTWLWAYPTYLLAGAPVMPGTLRYLLPAFPLALLVVGSPAPGTIPRRKVWLVIACCCVGLALQWWWIDNVLIVSEYGPTNMVP